MSILNRHHGLIKRYSINIFKWCFTVDERNRIGYSNYPHQYNAMAPERKFNNNNLFLLIIVNLYLNHIFVISMILSSLLVINGNLPRSLLNFNKRARLWLYLSMLKGWSPAIRFSIASNFELFISLKRNLVVIQKVNDKLVKWFYT